MDWKLSLGQPCVILFFDVDGFKHINDTYGHAFGDEALKKIGRAIWHQYAKYGKCFWYGGDDPDNQNIQDAVAEADKMMYEFKAKNK